MIDVTGGFDPRNLLKKPPGIGMETGGPQDPIDMYRSDMPPGVMGGASPPQTPVSMERSAPQTPISSSFNPNQIPNVPPHQPIGGGGVVPEINGMNTGLPMGAAPTPNTTSPISVAPSRPPGTPEDWIAQPGSNNQTYGPPPPSDPRLAYGYNPGQWGINKRIDDMAGKMDWSNNSYGLNANSWAKMQPGYLADLPDQAEYQAYQSKILQPYNQSVASESAAGRPGHSGEVPNYTAPTTGMWNAGGNLVGNGDMDAASLAQRAEVNAQQQLLSQPTTSTVIPPQDRWLGTQRRQPNYF